MLRTNIYLDEEQTSRLDRLACDEHVSRAEIVRQLLDQALAGRVDAVADDLAAIRASFGSVQDVEVTPRVDSERDRHMADMWAL